MTRTRIALPIVGAMLCLLLLAHSASAANSYFKNSSIADVAERSRELSYGGQCMRFVHNVLWTVSSNRINTSAYRDGYQGTFKASGGTLIGSSSSVIRGDIIQITPKGTSDSWKGPERWPLHTAIVRQNLGGGNFAVIDSNFSTNNDERVRRHSFNPYSFAARYGGGIVKIWRLGSVPAAPPAGSPPPPSAQPPPAAKPPAPSSVPDRLSNNGTLIASKNQYLRSADSRYRFVMQQDSNLVLYGPSGRALWASNTVGRGVSKAVMQADGNLVLYTSTGKPVWASNTELHYHAYLVVQNDGNVVIYEGHTPLWATGTDGRT